MCAGTVQQHQQDVNLYNGRYGVHDASNTLEHVIRQREVTTRNCCSGKHLLATRAVHGVNY